MLEFSTPPGRAFRAAYDAYSFAVIPRLGQAIAGDRESYQYLVESIRKFPLPVELGAMMEGAGFREVGWSSYTGGVAVLHVGWKV